MAKTKPEQGATRENAATIDLRDERFDLPTVRTAPTLQEVLGQFEAFAEAHHDQAGEAARRCQEIADRFRPLDTRRVLGMADAVRITGLSESRIKQYSRDNAKDFGEKKGKFWLYSEAELVDLANSERQPGRPKKEIPAT